MPGIPGSSGTCGFGPSLSVTFEYAPPERCCGVRCCPTPPAQPPCCTSPCPCPPPPCPLRPPSRICPTCCCGAPCPTPAAVPENTMQPIQIWGCTPHVCCSYSPPHCCRPSC